jgi:hypothetical protein
VRAGASPLPKVHLYCQVYSLVNNVWSVAWMDTA